MAPSLARVEEAPRSGSSSLIFNWQCDSVGQHFLRSEVRSFLSKRCVADDEIGEALLCLGELVTNVAIHPKDKGELTLRVEVFLVLQGPQGILVLKVSPIGQEIDVTALKKGLAALNARIARTGSPYRKGRSKDLTGKASLGIGLFLIREYTDTFTFSPSDYVLTFKVSVSDATSG